MSINGRNNIYEMYVANGYKAGLGVSLDELCPGSEYRLTALHHRKIEELHRGLRS